MNCLTPVVLMALFCLAMFTTSSNGLNAEGIQDYDESTTPKLIAGIPYGSISGRVAEYFATFRPKTVKPLADKDIINEEDTKLNHL